MNRNRFVSGSVAAIYLTVALWGRGAEAGFVVAAFLILPLSCIWFSDAMGGFVGPVWRGAITGPSPALLVRIAGWLLLLLPAIVGIVYALAGSRS